MRITTLFKRKNTLKRVFETSHLDWPLACFWNEASFMLHGPDTSEGIWHVLTERRPGVVDPGVNVYGNVYDTEFWDCMDWNP